MTEHQPESINLRMHTSNRAVEDIESIYAILDKALVCHVGIVEGGVPYVIPHNFGRLGDELVMHGALGGRLMKHIASGELVCVEVTLLDSLVLARSMFMHSVNYRSVMVFGRGRLIETDSEKLQALKAISDQLMPGRWEECRQPNQKELNATKVIGIKIESVTAKVNIGLPEDKSEDLDFPVWAGILPLNTVADEPISAEELDPTLIPMSGIRNFKRAGIG
ncbi:MAG TPA: pyridoxamine 5'-phosphate oxidase family protein [Anaerolineales bacterium]|nr:pyridoxamine 5'-phosphate oxidase family protein [Anaerolineales bacterium]